MESECIDEIGPGPGLAARVAAYFKVPAALIGDGASRSALLDHLRGIMARGEPGAEAFAADPATATARLAEGLAEARAEAARIDRARAAFAVVEALYGSGTGPSVSGILRAARPAREAPAWRKDARTALRSAGPVAAGPGGPGGAEDRRARRAIAAERRRSAKKAERAERLARRRARLWGAGPG